MVKPYTDTAKYWTTALLPDAELLTATFRDHRFGRHWHDTYVIPVIQAGAQGYWYRGSQHTAGARTIAAINPGEIHTGERAAPQGWEYRVFYPTVAWMQALATTVIGRPACPPWFSDRVIIDPEVAAQLVSAHVLLENGVDQLEAEMALHYGFASLILRHARSRPQRTSAQNDPARVTVMQERLTQALTESITLTELASVVGLSPFHAARLFTRTVGMAPHAWRNQVRLNRALRWLRSGMSATDVAALAGFFDQSHFTRHFKRAYGISPGALVTNARQPHRKNIQAPFRPKR